MKTLLAIDLILSAFIPKTADVKPSIEQAITMALDSPVRQIDSTAISVNKAFTSPDPLIYIPNDSDDFHPAEFIEGEDSLN